MKLDSESPYHHTCLHHEHDMKVIVHNDNPFILAKDNHYMIDMLNIDKITLKEGKHGLASPVERKSSIVTSPPRQYLSLEDSISRNKGGDDSMEALYSAPSSDFEMVVKEDFYTDKITTKVELTEMKVCIEDDPCYIMEDKSVDTVVRSPDRYSVEKDVDGMEPSLSNQTLDNGHNYLTREMTGSASADDLKYTVFNNPLIIVDKDQADPFSVLHNDSDGMGCLLSSFDCGGKLDMVSNTSVKVIEIPPDQDTVFDNDSDGKSSSLSSVNSDVNLDATESVVSNISPELAESPVIPTSDFHNESDGKVSSASLIDSRGKLDTSESVASDTSTEVTEIPVSDVYNKCVGKRSSVSSIQCGGKLGHPESISNNIPAEVTESQFSSSQGINTNSLQMDSSSLTFSNDQKQSIDGEKYKDTSEERNSAFTSLSFRSEVTVLSNGSKELRADNQVPGGVITFSFETEAASTSGRDENEETSRQQSEMAKSGPGMEESMVDSTAASARFSFLNLMQGESNLSGPDILSGPIANSGHIPYSGSISLRSDSSTTSARSFAFPILQSEWNSSPVKMAKADRRRLRKHRGWKLALLCCRF